MVEILSLLRRTTVLLKCNWTPAGLARYDKGSWKSIARLVGSRSPAQVQSHAQKVSVTCSSTQLLRHSLPVVKYFLRRLQAVKSNRSIHDITFADEDELLQDGDGPTTTMESPATTASWCSCCSRRISANSAVSGKNKCVTADRPSSLLTQRTHQRRLLQLSIT